jgi:hypothetical protein
VIWFEFVFPAIMVLTPLGLVLAFRPAPEGEPGRRRVGLLAAATVLALAVVVSARILAGEASVVWTWTLFFPLWFGLGMPALRVRRPLWFGAEPSGAVRSASLASRREATSIRPGILAAAWAVLVTGIVAVGVRPLAAMDGAAWIRWTAALGVLVAVEVPILLLLPRWFRRLGQEPEPFGPESGPDTAEAYRKVREFRGRGMAIGMLCLLILVSAFAAVLVWSPPDGASILAGAGAALGTLIGIAGAAFGTAATLRKEKIAREVGEAREAG